jgi:thioredoxin-dependent peroxiredoxin
MLLKEGVRAPAFALQDKENRTHRLEDLMGEYTVVYFYPKDNTPGCTVEAQAFTKDLKKFSSAKTRVIGISGGDAKSKAKFCEQCKLGVLLLSDSDFRISKKYGVYGEKSFMGRKFLGIKRITFVLDKKGKIIKIFDKVSPKEHSKEVLEFVKSLRSDAVKPPGKAAE